MFILYFFLCSLTLILNRISFDNLIQKFQVTTSANNLTENSTTLLSCFEETEHGTYANKACQCLMLYPTDDLRYVRIV